MYPRFSNYDIMLQIIIEILIFLFSCSLLKIISPRWNPSLQWRKGFNIPSRTKPIDTRQKQVIFYLDALFLFLFFSFPSSHYTLAPTPGCTSLPLVFSSHALLTTNIRFFSCVHFWSSSRLLITLMTTNIIFYPRMHFPTSRLLATYITFHPCLHFPSSHHTFDHILFRNVTSYIQVYH